ncbi:DNA-binding MarR family transcriptional regulator [Halopolyspora algeriensis]|uniref:DNA-binding MarR family transcriptional regulator n=1 Tax=Halopolyspora algeriensis TaxID=1500506 RepID=A0A368VYS8_9ACTN|nr:MarR family transcriptional regulator [Halopolyspora algeriensis]RCW47147.1 DNA-binding MarR family transcriptional regulator [Halopolyspora algeriensis]TQM48233.1 DNA-binding MarR family transcriptional regulator [Halopolyspora algeriensis]
MQPDADLCGELLTPLRALIGLKQLASHWGAVHGDDTLPYAAAGLLGELVHCGESPLGELAQHRIVDASVVSRQAAQLEQAGMIARRPDPADRRISLLSATPVGEQAFAALEREKKEWLSHALRGWNDSEVQQLTNLLHAASRDLRTAAHELLEHTDPTHSTQEGAR